MSFLAILAKTKKWLQYFIHQLEFHLVFPEFPTVLTGYKLM